MKEFFKRYAEAFDDFSAEAISLLYALPCAISDVDGNQVFSERAPLIEKLTKNCASMRDIGYVRADFTILDEQSLGEDKKAVNIGWRVITKTIPIEFRTLYICQYSGEDWSIFTANVYPGSFD